MSVKIAPNLIPLIVERANEGQKSWEISAWLLSEHGVTISDRTIRRLLRDRRAEAADVAKAVVREELRKHVLPCVNHALDLRERARRIEIKARKDGKAELQLKAQDRQRYAIELVLHHAGLNEPETVAPNIGGENPRQKLLSRFEQLISDAKSEPLN